VTPKLLCKGCGYTLGVADCILNTTKICNKCGSVTHFAVSGVPRTITATLMHEGEIAAERRIAKEEAENRHFQEVERMIKGNHYVDRSKC
jgi:hypothetical protein